MAEYYTEKEAAIRNCEWVSDKAKEIRHAIIKDYVTLNKTRLLCDIDCARIALDEIEQYIKEQEETN